jgi:hypothetical protein
MITYKVTISDDGTKRWWLNGKLHREDGPAVEVRDIYKVWYINGKRHRTDGPAYESHDGRKEWWINGIQLTEQEWKYQVHIDKITSHLKKIETINIEGKDYTIAEIKEALNKI